jgi:predicted secreted protein with PEFG-CTERM motif
MKMIFLDSLRVKYFLILLVFAGILIPNNVFAQEAVFEIWPTKSVVSYPDFPTMEFTINPAPSGPFEEFSLKDFDDSIDERVPKDNILVLYLISYPDGKKETNITHYHLADILEETTKAPFSTLIQGEYSISAQIIWKTNSEFFSYTSNTVTVTAKEPIFRGDTKEIEIKRIWGDLFPYDWNSDDLILFRYTHQVSRDEWRQNLATITPDGSDLTTLSIPQITEEQQIFDAQFSPNGKSIHMILDDRFLYQFDLESEQVTQLTFSEVYDFDYYHYSEANPENYSIIVSANTNLDNPHQIRLLDIGDGKDENSILNSHALVYDFESSQFDISPDGKKILFKKTLNSSFPPIRVLAYHPAQGDVVEVQSQSTNCGSEPKWSPNGEMIVHISSGCSRGPPGGTIHLTTVDGQYHEILLPYTNNNPRNVVFSPDGAFMVYTSDQNLAIMTLAKPIPEFGTITMMILLICVFSVILFSKSKLSIAWDRN